MRQLRRIAAVTRACCLSDDTGRRALVVRKADRRAGAVVSSPGVSPRRRSGDWTPSRARACVSACVSPRFRRAWQGPA